MSHLSELRYFLTNAPWVTLDQIVRMSAGLIISVVFARLATPNIYGQYQYVIALLAILSFISLGGLNISVMRAVITGAEQSLRRAVRISFLSSLLAIPLLLILASWKYTHGQPQIGLALVVGALLFAPLYATNTWISFLVAKKRFRAVAIRTIILQILLTFSLTIGIWLKVSLPILIAIFGGIQGSLHLIYYITTARLISGTRQDLDIRLGLKITVQKFSQTLTASLPLLILAAIYSYNKVAIYSVFFSLFP